MTPRAKVKTEAPKSTAQQLATVIAACRKIMRKDKGLSTDVERLPLLTWIMFLKFLDDIEQLREEEAKLARARYTSAIEAPYRWRDWANKEDGITGPELLSFINQEEAVRPDGTKGPGLFAYLRSLQSRNGDRRDVIARVFKDTVNPMRTGYLLRDIINKVNSIHFTSKDEVHTLSLLYESILREIRDAAGNNGEFYTPRPVVKFIVSVINPQLGETVLDPAAGTGGFLVESFTHLAKQARRAEDYKRLQKGTLFGIEAKPLPYLLCQMNLLLHGIEYPDIDPENALRVPLREIGDRERVDVVMTNPPFGGEEERGILSNFPSDKQTSETALLFLQLIMRKLKRRVGGSAGGRGAVVVPNGFLSGDGVSARIKEELLTEFNLHTIVRLPIGVFAPYTPIPTNVLFFDRSQSTEDVWFYEMPLPKGRKTYTKTSPLQLSEFNDCLNWWSDRVENDQAWKTTAAVIRADNFNLDTLNPRRPAGPETRSSTALLDSLLEKERRVVALLEEAKNMLPLRTE